MTSQAGHGVQQEPGPHGVAQRGSPREALGSVRAVHRSLQILSVLAHSPQTDIALEVIARRAALPKSTTHRLLDTLSRERFVEPGERAGSYRLGIESAVVGSAAMRMRRPREEIHELVRLASERTGETVGLSMISGRRVVIVDKVASPRPLHWNLNIGATLNACQSAAGKVLLGALCDEDIRALFGNAEDLPVGDLSTPHTLRTIAQLLIHVANARINGYATDDQEVDIDLRCVSVPVRNVWCETEFALSVSAPASRLQMTDAAAVASELQNTAELIAPHLHAGTILQ